MKTAEQFKEILARYYRRDDDTKSEYEAFISQKSHVSLKSLLVALPSVEEKFKLKLPQEYKNFIAADSAWGMYGGEEDFRIYDEDEIYEFNCIGKHEGRSSIEELKDYFLFGQDEGACSYFFDPFNRLGYGIDAVWRIDRCSCDKRDFELVAKDFYELTEKFCDKKDEDFERPFENEKPVYEGTPIKDILEKQVENNSDLMKKISDMQEKIKDYYDIMIVNGVRRAIITEYDYDEEGNYKLQETTNIPLDVLYLIQKNIYTLSYFDKHFFGTVCDEPLISINYGKYSMKILKDMFVFAEMDSIVNKESKFMTDFFFVDPTNILGNGSEAVYLICTKAKKLEEACYVAKDIVDLFRLFAEGEELNTTPIGNKINTFPKEIKETLYYENIIVVLYRKNKEIPNNVEFFDLNGNKAFTINDIVKAKIPRGYDHIEKKNETILIAECEIGIIYEIDINNKIIIDKEFVR